MQNCAAVMQIPLAHIHAKGHIASRAICRDWQIAVNPHLLWCYFTSQIKQRNSSENKEQDYKEVL